jgi:hypothetical protein
VPAFALRLPSFISLCGLGGILNKRSAIRRVGSSISGFWGFAMTDFKDLDPDIRAYALIGQFLKRWSELEQQIHEAIGAALGLDETRRYILCANLQLKDKVNVLRTLVQQSSFPIDVKVCTNKELTTIQNYTHRNMIAHDSFEPDLSGDGVVFFPVKAKKEFSRPLEKWGIEKFKEEGKAIAEIAENVARLKARFSRETTFELPPFGWVDTMQGSPVPMRHIMSPALLDSLSHSVPMPPSSDPPNQEKIDQTPDKPQEKE